MGDKTGIAWTDATWNPVTGCSKVSAGCKFCYAERDFARPYPGRKFTDVRMHEDRLDHPLRWRRPRRIFVNSMGDLFHESVPWEFIRRVFHIMFCSERHIFQVLTKRPENMLAFCRQTGIDEDAASLRTALGAVEKPAILPNVWLGVSVEDQESADKRIPLLLQTPAAVRWVSYEPALGPVDFHRTIPCGYYCDESIGHVDHGPNGNLGSIDWIVAGGESGPKARPSDIEWYRSVRDQCKAAGVSFFMKQLGAHPYFGNEFVRGKEPGEFHEPWLDLKDRKGGDPEEWPKDLRIREYPDRRI